MAVKQNKKAKSFDKDFDDAPIVQENKLILEQGREQEQKQNVPYPAGSSEEQPAETSKAENQPAAEQRVAPAVDMKPMKSTKTVKLILPMEYYFKLVQIKACTDKSLQDLAAQAVMDFVDHFGKEQVNEKSDLLVN